MDNRMIGNRAPGTIWTLRDLGYPFVRTGPGDTVEFILDPAVLYAAQVTGVLRFSRADARLFAKRVNQCLDSTVKR